MAEALGLESLDLEGPNDAAASLKTRWRHAPGDRRRRDGGGELSEDERAELARLSKENAALTMRCGVLKRTQGCWATTCCPPRRGAR